MNVLLLLDNGCAADVSSGHTPNAITKLLKRLGFVDNRPKCVPAKADRSNSSNRPWPR
jgi:hypothetical protein